MSHLPITAKDIATATSNDPELKQLYNDIRLGSTGNGYEKYSIQDGCILFGIRVWIPKVHQDRILEEIHAGHVGVVKMKSLPSTFLCLLAKY